MAGESATAGGPVRAITEADCGSVSVGRLRETPTQAGYFSTVVKCVREALRCLTNESL